MWTKRNQTPRRRVFRRYQNVSSLHLLSLFQIIPITCTYLPLGIWKRLESLEWRQSVSIRRHPFVIIDSGNVIIAQMFPSAVRCRQSGSWRKYWELISPVHQSKQKPLLRNFDKLHRSPPSYCLRHHKYAIQTSGGFSTYGVGKWAFTCPEVHAACLLSVISETLVGFAAQSLPGWLHPNESHVDIWI